MQMQIVSRLLISKHRYKQVYAVTFKEPKYWELFRKRIENIFFNETKINQHYDQNLLSLDGHNL